MIWDEGLIAKIGTPFSQERFLVPTLRVQVLRS